MGKQELQQAISVAAKGAATHSTLPVLTGIKLTAAEGFVTFEATNLDLSIRTTSAALVDEEGEAVLPAKTIGDIVKSLPDAAIHVETDGEGSVRVNCDAAAFSVKALPAEDFPGFPDIDPEDSLTLPFDTFSRMVKAVARVVSKDMTRAILTAVLIEAGEGIVRMVATDSYRITLAEEDYEGRVEDFKVAIDGGFLSGIAALPVLDSVIDLGVAENQVIITYGTTTFINRRIEGNYPPYAQLFTPTCETSASFDTQALLDATRRCAIMSAKSSPLRVDINADTHSAQLTCATPDMGSASELVQCTVEGPDVLIGFNQRNFQEGLQLIPTDKVTLELNGALRPGVLRAADPSRFLYLIMPLRLMG